jgi:GH24 family phage-related lysozyme (muramidase)
MKTISEELTSYRSIIEGTIPNRVVEESIEFVLNRYPDAKVVITSGKGSVMGHYDLVVTKKLAEDAESNAEAWVMAAHNIKQKLV